MHNLIEYSNNYSKISASLWQYYRDKQALNNASTLVDFPGNSASFKFKQKNNRFNRHWWNKSCSNNGTIEVFK